MRLLFSLSCWSTFLLFPSFTIAEDWPMGGRSRDRNPVSPEKGAPIDWQVPLKDQQPRNIRWIAQHSGDARNAPVIANGLIWIGNSNYRHPHDPAITGDRGVLACFRESDGKFLYQYTSPRLEQSTND